MEQAAWEPRAGARLVAQLTLARKHQPVLILGLKKKKKTILIFFFFLMDAFRLGRGGQAPGRKSVLQATLNSARREDGDGPNLGVDQDLCNHFSLAWLHLRI